MSVEQQKLTHARSPHVELTAVGVVENNSSWLVAVQVRIALVVVDGASLGVLEARSVGLLEGVEDAHVVVPGEFESASSSPVRQPMAALTWR